MEFTLANKNRVGLLLLFCFTMVQAYSQAIESPTIDLTPPETEEKRRINLPATTENWNGLYMKFRVSEKFFYYQETHYRRRSASNRGNPVQQMGQIYNRFGITYLMNPNFEITLGPHIALRFTPEPENENTERVVVDARIWHQYLFNHSMGRAKILHQFRFEHRWRRENDIGAQYFFSNRWRYKIASYIPINKPRMENKTFYFFPSNEVFFEAGSHIPNIFEENRFYTAFGYVYGNFQIYAGHMWTYGSIVFPTYRNRHIFRFNIMYNLDLRKDKLRPKFFD
jgi:hypothetical protein